MPAQHINQHVCNGMALFFVVNGMTQILQISRLSATPVSCRRVPTIACR
jgi:hypothetical protein